MDEQAAHTSEFRDPLLGRLLHDRYRVLCELGRGGMGVVYLAEHVLLHRRVAIKMLHPQSMGSEELVLRFHREARAAAGIGNDHIVDVTDMGRLEDGSYYLALEYLDGGDLADVVATERALPVPRAVSIAMQICDALAAVHDAGIVHRDLKPENVFLIKKPPATDFVKVLDFGICKFMNDRPLTATGVALGTPRFMSPEQLEARPDVDHRADLYAVGAILFFALTGQGPFDGVSLPQLVVSIWRDPPPPLRSLCPNAPEALERLVMRALDKNPARRFQSALELKHALAPFLDPSYAAGLSEPTQTRRNRVRKPSIRETFSRALTIPGRRRVRPWTLGASALLACGALLSLWFAAGDPRDPHAMPRVTAAPVPVAAHTEPSARLRPPPSAADSNSNLETETTIDTALAPPVTGIAPPRRRAPSQVQPAVAAPTSPAPEPARATPEQPPNTPVPAPPPTLQPDPNGAGGPWSSQLKRVF